MLDFPPVVPLTEIYTDSINLQLDKRSKGEITTTSDDFDWTRRYSVLSICLLSTWIAL